MGKWTLLGATALAALAPLAAVGASGDGEVAAVWTRHERYLSYMGVTSYYSCSGLESKLKTLLLLAGARADLQVRASCSEASGGPSRISGARLTYYTLALPGSPQESPPAAPLKNLGHAAKALEAAPEPPVPGAGAWKKVDLGANRMRDMEPGDCELVEQFDRELLADFTIRNHSSHFTCVPHQQTQNGIQSTFEVLAPLPKAAATTPPAHQ